MKYGGHNSAEAYYESVVKSPPHEPAYELFYANYLRINRGPQHPLLPEAEQHYFAALETIQCAFADEGPMWKAQTAQRLGTGFTCLHLRIAA